MSRIPVLTQTEKTLREPSVEVPSDTVTGERIQTLIADMIETMHLENGVGIAAPQVGVNERVIVVDGGSGPEAFLNPVITSKSFSKVDSEEGCLSVPGVFGIVKRHKKVRVSALDADGNPVKLKLSGFPAIVFQHEIDHLDGVLFIDKVERYTSPPRM